MVPAHGNEDGKGILMGNVGVWDVWYAGSGREEPRPYGDVHTYGIGADWLAGCGLVADWGCGFGWLRTLIEPDRYIGIDGSQTPHADIIADLTEYREPTPGVFMRHVIEHNREWRKVLANAVASAQERMVLILFTPMADATCDLPTDHGLDVPDISFALVDLEPFFDGMTVQMETLATGTQYGVETVFLMERGVS
jgi:hypothetical protein